MSADVYITIWFGVRMCRNGASWWIHEKAGAGKDAGPWRDPAQALVVVQLRTWKEMHEKKPDAEKFGFEAAKILVPYMVDDWDAVKEWIATERIPERCIAPMDCGA